MQQARGAIDAARAAGADRYARTELSAAQELLTQASDAVEQRDYRLALNYALDSREQAQNAARQAADNKAAARVEADRALSAADTALAEARAKLKAAEAARAPRLAVDKAQRTIAEAERTVQKARAAIDQTDYVTIREMLAGTIEPLHGVVRDLDAARAPAARRRR